MATYVPGSKTYSREIQPFTPDYKFLSSVLDTRQDRYDTNYKQLSDLYGKVVYADLSREDTIGMRDQYANQLAPKIQQISGMDLSLRQNVDSAKSVFKPFYEDDLIVKDLVYTRQYKQNAQRALTFKDSDNVEQRKKYWSTGMQYLNYQMEDFKTADRDAALKQGLPTYIENVDLYSMSTKLLKDAGFGDVEIDIPDPTGHWIIREKNGKQQVPGAYNFLQKTLMEDPRVMDAYRASGYVDSRNFAQKGLDNGLYSTVLEGQTAWAKDKLSDLAQRNATANEIIKQQFDEALKAKENWEEYERTSGVTPNSPEAKAMLEAIEQYDKSRGALERNEETLQRVDNINIDEDPDLLNKAFNLLMNYNLSTDILGAAKAHSMKDYSRTITANPYKKLEVQHKYSMARIEQQHINRKKEIALKAQLDPTLESTANGNLVDALFGGSTTGITKNSTEVREVEDAMADNTQRAAAYAQETNKGKTDFILKIDQLSKMGGSLQNTNYNSMEIKLNDGSTFKGSYDQIKAKLSEEGNENLVDLNYDNAVKTLTNKLPANNPKALESPQLVEAYSMYNAIQGRQSKSIAYEKSLNKVLGKNYDLLKVGTTKGGAELVRQLEANIPELVITSKNNDTQRAVLSKDDFVAEYLKRAKNGQIVGKDYIEGRNGRNDDGSRSVIQISMFQGAADYLQEKTDKYIWGDTIFVETEAKKDAEEAYKLQYNLLNQSIDGTLNINEMGGSRTFQPFSAEAVFRGVPLEEMNESNLFTYQGYGATFNVNTIARDKKAQEMIFNFKRQYDMTADKVVMTQSATEVENNPNAKFIVDEIIRDSRQAMLDPKSAASKKLSYQIEYNPVETIDGKSFASYTLRSDYDYIKDFTGATKGTGGGKNTAMLNPMDIPEYTSIKVLVPSEQDMNPKRAGQYNVSAIETAIDLSEDKVYNYDAFSEKAGSFKVFKNNNNYYVAMEMMQLDPKTGLFNSAGIQDPILVQDENGPAGKHNIDNFVNHYQLIMMEEFRRNIEKEQAWKKKNKAAQ